MSRVLRFIRRALRLSKCPACGYHAFNGQECFDCGYRS